LFKMLLQNNVIIDGNGYNITGDGLTGDAIHTIGYNSTTAYDLEIYDFAYGVNLLDTQYNSFDNLTMNGISSYAMWITNSQYDNITNCNVDNSLYALWPQNADYIRVINFTADVSSIGVTPYGDADNGYYENININSGGYAIVMGAGSDYNQWFNVIVTDNGGGYDAVNLWDSDYNNLTNVTITNAADDVVDIWDSNYNILINFTITGSASNDVELSGTSDNNAFCGSLTATQAISIDTSAPITF